MSRCRQSLNARMTATFRMAALTAAVTKPRPVRTTTRSMVHSADGDQCRLVS
jgi:hypothetical protein